MAHSVSGSRLKSFGLRHKLLFGVLGAGALILVGVVIGGLVFLSGTVSTAATTQHSALTFWILQKGLQFSIAQGAREVRVPALTSDDLVRQGLVCYQAHCAACHGAPGQAAAAIAQGMMPVPDNLNQAARDWPPSWVYYVVKRGIRMTGMPAWEYRMSERNLWSTVAFLRILPHLDKQAYTAMAAEVAESPAGSRPCGMENEATQTNPYDAGAVVLRQYACHSCHRIDGVVGPKTDAGPPLVDWNRRKYIAGTLPNTVDNLVLWIRHPTQVSPRTMMPDMNVTAADARAMAAFLMASK